MKKTESPLCSGHLPGFALSLYERVAHIPRGLTVNSMDQMSRISRKVLRSKLR